MKNLSDHINENLVNEGKFATKLTEKHLSTINQLIDKIDQKADESDQHHDAIKKAINDEGDDVEMMLAHFVTDKLDEIANVFEKLLKDLK